MSEANKQLARRWFREVWNQGRAESIDEMLDTEGIIWGLPDPESFRTGPAEFRPFFEQFRGAFPNIAVEVNDVIAEGDRVAIRWTATMTHHGDHLGFNATGKDAKVTGLSFVRVKNGKLVEGWNHWDTQGLMRQLGQA